jgi:hypothetical protein
MSNASCLCDYILSFLLSILLEVSSFNLDCTCVSCWNAVIEMSPNAACFLLGTPVQTENGLDQTIMRSSIYC